MKRSNVAYFFLIWAVGFMTGISFTSEISRHQQFSSVHDADLEELVSLREFDTVIVGAESLDWPRFRHFLDDCLDAYVSDDEYGKYEHEKMNVPIVQR